MANTNSKEQALLIDQDKGKPWIQIFDIIENLSVRSIWYHSKWQKENLGLFCVHCFKSRATVGLCYAHIPQLITHRAYATNLSIPQRVTESQNVHLSSHDGLPNFLTSNMLHIGPRIYLSGDRVAGICPSLSKYYICQVIGLLFSDWSLFTT